MNKCNASTTTRKQCNDTYIFTCWYVDKLIPIPIFPSLFINFTFKFMKNNFTRLNIAIAITFSSYLSFHWGFFTLCRIFTFFWLITAFSLTVTHIIRIYVRPIEFMVCLLFRWDIFVLFIFLLHFYLFYAVSIRRFPFNVKFCIQKRNEIINVVCVWNVVVLCCVAVNSIKTRHISLLLFSCCY